jgi:hypothetical protein
MQKRKIGKSAMLHFASFFSLVGDDLLLRIDPNSLFVDQFIFGFAIGSKTQTN